MVMFLFVIAYLGWRVDTPWASGSKAQRWAAAIAACALLVEILVVIAAKADGRLSSSAKIERSFGSPGEIGRLFLTDHLIAFEITSIVLLVAAVGGVILGSHAKDESSMKDADARA
jgi:NADH:ubiquinone oxidoreductase subunit 6 (subunit J)